MQQTEEQSAGILYGSADTEDNRRTIAKLKKALPEKEWRAVSAWLTTFYGYQQNWLLDWERFSLLLKCRQIGASHAYAAANVLWGMLGETTTVISVGEREAIEYLEKVARHSRALQRLGSHWASAQISATAVKFATGGRVLALPSTSGGRSYSGSIVLDEAAYYQHPEKIWDGAGATVMRGGRMRILSTPNGVGNLFHKLWSDPKSNRGYRKHATTIDQARADGYKISDETLWRMARGDPRVYSQMFACSFLDGELQYIPTALISDAATEDIYCHSGETFAGLDIGRVNDRTSLRIIKRDADGVMWNIHGESLSRTSSDDIDRLASVALNDFRCSRLCVDSTGMGAFPAADLQKRYGRFKVEPVTFTMQSKEDMATTMYQAFAERAMRIPRDDEQLRNDLCAIRRIVTSAGNIRYDAPQTDDGHGDDAWALALAIYASARPDKRRREID